MQTKNLYNLGKMIAMILQDGLGDNEGNLMRAT